MTKVVPYSDQWYEYLNQALVSDFGDDYRSCGCCGKPTHSSYICRWCGKDDSVLEEED